MSDVSELKPDFGLAMFEAGHEGKLFEFSRVSFEQVARQTEDTFVITIGFHHETVISFEFGRPQLAELCALIPTQIASWIEEQFAVPHTRADMLTIPTITVGIDATLGSPRSNDNETWVPFIVSTFSQRSPLSSLNIRDAE